MFFTENMAPLQNPMPLKFKYHFDAIEPIPELLTSTLGGSSTDKSRRWRDLPLGNALGGTDVGIFEATVTDVKLQA